MSHFFFIRRTTERIVQVPVRADHEVNVAWL
jgi:hypothetical protein